jgi:hypothetical protein
MSDFRWTGRPAVGGVINVPDDDEASYRIEQALTSSSPVERRSKLWHDTWERLEHLPAWDLPFWAGTDIDVHNWDTPNEFANFFAWNMATCYIWLNRITAGIRPTENDILSLLTSSEENQTPQILDATSAHIIRVKLRVEQFVFENLDGISPWEAKCREVVDYPTHGLLSTLTLIRANFNENCDDWLYEVDGRRDRRRAVKRVQNYIRLIKHRRLMTSAETLSRIG